jgi:hypothetical protein
MPFDDAMVISTPVLWPGPTCYVKRNTKCESMENFGTLYHLNGRTIPKVFTEVGVTFCYDSVDELLAAGWIIDDLS